MTRKGHTWAFVSGFSRRAFGSGVVAVAWFWRELNELFTLPPGVDVCDCGCVCDCDCGCGCGPGRGFSGSRGPPPLRAGGGCPWPFDDVISRVAGGSVLACCCCCLFFLPKRKDMARVALWRGRWGGSCGRSNTHSACDTDGCARRDAGC
jgi:hypothetical protein